MSIAETTALIAGVAVVAGTVTGGLFGLITEQFRASRETAQHEAERQVARDDLQRATLLELQDAMTDWLRGFSVYAAEIKAFELVKIDWFKAEPRPESMEAEVSARTRALKLVERVRNDALRVQVSAFTKAGIELAVRSFSYEEFWTRHQEFLKSWAVANEALGIELRKLL